MQISRGKGHGFVKKDGTICMERCFDCGMLNYAPAVNSGTCFFCKFEPGKHEPQHELHLVMVNRRRPCTKCAGFGEFNKDRTQMVKCEGCKSIHPNALGLAYTQTRDDMFIYMEKDEVK